MTTETLHSQHERTLVKITEDGRRVEVIDGVICLNGVEEAYELIPVGEHPNRQAIRQSVPGASYVAGRLPLTEMEAGIAQAALTRMRQDFSADPRDVMERLRHAVFTKAWHDGIE